MQLVLHADWQEVWHSLQPSNLMESCREELLIVTMCLDIMSPPETTFTLIIIAQKMRKAQYITSISLKKATKFRRWHLQAGVLPQELRLNIRLFSRSP